MFKYYYHWFSRHCIFLSLGGAAMFFGQVAFAADISDHSDAFYHLFTKIQSLLQGGLGVSLALSSFVLGVFASAFSHRLMPAAAGAGIAILVQYGPPIVISLTGAVI